ncbi:MAG: insulysin [Myxococcota bacterium]
MSDPAADMAAAALDVGVGQFHDPPDREGLAHFLEHMLFMGTDRYPDVDAYRRFVEDHGGATNAGTGQENTRYFFRIDHPHLQGALDRFSRFFCAPTLDPAYVTREREAVDSEYRLKLRDDGRRFREVRRQTVNPAYGFAKFSVGDSHTLADRPGQPVWDDLRAFWEREYSADRMALCVLGREPVDTLEDWVRARFAEVPARLSTPTPPATPYLPDQLGVRVELRPLVEVRSLRLEFPTPHDRDHYRERPLELISTLLGQETAGSLHAWLRERGWITGLSTGRDGDEAHRLFVIRAALTHDGYAHLDDVVDAIFQYIRRIRQAPTLAPWFDEQAQVAAIGFDCHQPPAPLNAVRVLAARLRDAPEAHLLDLPWVWGEYDHRVVHSYLALLVPHNARLFVAAPDATVDREERRYGTPWSITPLSPACLARWSDGPIDPGLTLPAPNPYVAERFDLLPLASPATAPSLVTSDPGTRVWHHHDISFRVPRATFRAQVVLPVATADLRARVTTVLYAAMLRDDITPLTDSLGRAGLSVGVAPTSDGLFLQVSGYDDKQPVVLDTVLQRIRSFQPTARRFDVERDRLLRQWRNAGKDYPIRQASWVTHELLDPTDFSFVEGAEQLSALTVDDITRFADGAFGAVAVDALAHGNLPADRAAAMGALVQSVLGESGPAPHRPDRVVRRIPAHSVLVDLDIEHDDSSIVVTWQGAEPSVSETARWLLLGALVRTSFFRVLRTDKQLGYSVNAAYHRHDTVPGLQCSIQSPVAGPEALLGHIDAFHEAFPAELADTSAERFRTIQDGLVAQLSKRDDTLYDRTARYARDLELGVTTFDRRPQLAAEVAATTLTDMSVFHRQRVLDNGRLVVQSAGRAHLRPTPPGTGRSTAISMLDRRFVRER